MQLLNVPGILLETAELNSVHLQREVKVDFYMPMDVADPGAMSLLLINDGQNMEELSFQQILTSLYSEGAITPLFCAAIHTGVERKMEYGVAGQPDYLGRGAKAILYTRFILEELLPFIRDTYAVQSFHRQAFAGFSLGGLTALDIVWNYPEQFSLAGIFSGSLWWRNLDHKEKEYDDDQHRIMHQVIRKGKFNPGQQFFFQSGNMDETHDRNNNGIIDSIDDTLDMIRELVKKGYDPEKSIHYLELAEGRHDLPTWAVAMPYFLKWGFGKHSS